ncbi:MAG TPA: hybrid sensor histidine kinase/response regulator [Polyangiaceae bacterium]|nr:hybrid sensor histidine kinase/response regulator [Polyangiaceae bacterium]
MSAADPPPAILVVDDHPANLLAMEAVLEPLGYRVVTATSGGEALKRLDEDHDYVLIVMDVFMPVLDGYTTVERIRQRERCRDIPVIFLTAVYNQPEHTYRGYALGAVDYISKPFDPEVLRGKIRALVLLYTRGERAERERSQHAERMRDLFLGAMSHDLRNPLSAIRLGAQMILRDADCARASHASHARRIEQASRRMQGIIDDLLDLTRGQFAGGVPVSVQPTDLAEVCRAVVDEFRVAREGQEVRLESPRDLVGLWDRDRLGRVVSNLVGNAMEHGEEGSIRVRLEDQDERAVLEVHNGGAPIDPATLPTIFEPFWRGDGGGSGLGLGLYIVREIVRAHGGTVRVTSTADAGTTFTVTLPKRLADFAESAKPLSD